MILIPARLAPVDLNSLVVLSTKREPIQTSASLFSRGLTIVGT